MIYHEKLKNIWKIASKEDYGNLGPIQNVMVDMDKKVIVSTDGHAMTMISIDGLIEDGEKSFMVPVAALKAAQTMYTREARGLRLKIYIRATDDEIIVSMQGTKNARIYDRPRGTYPKWEAIINLPTEYAAKVLIDAELLSRLSLSLNGEDRCTGVILYVPDNPENQIYVSVDHSDSLGTIMPMRLKTTNPPSRFWEREGK